ncbi:MAG: hypothetical protein AAF456_21910 [Planctomycetota bacterium]
MKFAKAITAVAAILAAFQFPGTVDAQQERGFRLPFRSRTANEAVPQNNGTLTAQAGPWMIMAASFPGANAEFQARALAEELQAAGMKAYVFQHTFEHQNTYEGIGWEVVETNGQQSIRPKRMTALNTPDITEVAVLVGDFPTIDDPAAQRALEQIKSMVPQSMAHFDPDRTDDVRIVREIARLVTSRSRGGAGGPMKSAFMMPNPMLPEGFFGGQFVDHFILDHNAQYDNPLMDNPKPFTVRVATFRGAATFELDEIAEAEQNFNWLRRNNQALRESKLVEATAKATLLTRELRQQGVEAYEFHDRHESYVCVGGFDWITRNNSSTGQEEYNPAVVDVINRYKAVVRDFPGVPNAVQPQYLESLRGTGIVFDAQPIPVAVPRAQTHAAQAGARRMR